MTWLHMHLFTQSQTWRAKSRSAWPIGDASAFALQAPVGRVLIRAWRRSIDTWPDAG